MDENGDGDGETFSRTAAVRAACFAAFNQLTESTSVAAALLIVFWVFDFLQLLVLPMSPSLAFPWQGMSSAKPLLMFLLPVALIPGTDYPAVASYSPSGMFLAAMAWTLCTVGVFAWLAASHAELTSYNPRWRVTVLRSLLWFGLNGFTVPIMSSLLGPFGCSTAPGDTWNGGPTCWGGGHMGFAIGAIVCAPLAAGALLGGACLVVSRVPDAKKNLMCLPSTGRVPAAVVAIKIGVTAFFVIVNGMEPTMSAWAHVVVNIIGFCAWGALVAYYLPFHVQWLNKLQCAISR